MTGEKLPANEALKQLDEAIDLGTVGEFFDELYSNIDAKKKIEDAGYDGVVAEFGRDNGDIILEYVAFNPEQVKIKKEEKDILTFTLGNIPLDLLTAGVGSKLSKGRVIAKSVIKEACLDKQKVKEAIERHGMKKCKKGCMCLLELSKAHKIL